MQKNKKPINLHIQRTQKLGYLEYYGHYGYLTGYNKSVKTVKIVDPTRTIKMVFNTM